MKKILILLLFLIPIANAQEITINLAKNNYNNYETIQADILMNLSLAEKITASNFGLIDKNNITIPVSIFLDELSKNHYYVYFNIPKIQNDTYYFIVKNVKYLDNYLKKMSKTQEFYLNDFDSISIYPGIFNNKISGTLKITNHGQKTNITIISKELNLNQKFVLNDNYNLNLNIPKNINNFDIRIEYENDYYLIPVLTYKDKITNNASTNNTIINNTFINQSNLTNQSATKDEIKKNEIVLLNSTYGTYFNDNFQLNKELTLKGPFYIKNTFDYPIENISFVLNDNLKEIVKLNLSFVEKINQNETITQYIWLNENQNASKIYYSGKIEIKSNNKLLTFLPLEINFIEKKIKQENITIEKKQKIDNKTISNLQEKEKSNKKLVIIFLLIVVLVIGAFIYYLFKKPKAKTFDEFLSKK